MKEQINESLFGMLVLSLGNAALVGMGLIADPESNTKVVDLDLANNNIEILAMLQEKTKGNLNQPELKLLNDLLYDLRMKFVEISRQVC